MKSEFLQPWTTIRGASAIASITQDAEAWLDLSEYSDATVWVDVREATAPSGSLSLSVESAPYRDEMLFLPVGPSVTLAAASTATTFKSVLSKSTPGLAKWTRWKITASGVTATWSATFRVRVSASRTQHFSPLQLSGCVAWLRSDLGITLDPGGGGGVKTWADQSGQGNDATQSTTNRQPTVSNAQIGALPGLYFNASSAGNEKFLGLPSLSSLTALHAFAVGKRVAANPPSSARAGFWTLGTSLSPTGVPFTDGNIYDDAGATARKSCGAVAGLNSPFIYEVASAASSWTNWVSGTQQFTTGTNTVALPSSPYIGESATGASPTFYDGYFAEILFFNRVLSSGDQTRVRRYLGGRYGISVP